MRDMKEKLDHILRHNLIKSIGLNIKHSIGHDVVWAWDWSVGIQDAGPEEMLKQIANDAHDVEETNNA